MPKEWRNIRSNERKVRPDFYLALDQLISDFHCSKVQAVAGVIVTANCLFGRNWKFHDEDDDIIDVNTAPSTTQIRASGKAIGRLKNGPIITSSAKHIRID